MPSVPTTAEKTPFASITPEMALAMRQMYIDGVPVAQICRTFGVSQGALYYWLDGGPAEGPRHLEPIPRRNLRHDKYRLSGNRAALVARLWRTAEGQVREIEDRLKRHGQQPDERECDARMLAVLAKTLRELTALDERQTAPQADQNDDDGCDIDEFRRELARRMDAVVAARTANLPGDDQSE
jgi:transposase-like protein